MNKYRSNGLIKVERVKIGRSQVTIRQQPPRQKELPAQSPKPAARIIRATPPPAPRAAQPASPPPQTRPTVRPMKPVQAVKQPRHIGENRRSVSSRAAAQEQYREPIMNLKGVGYGRILVMVACGPSVNELAIERLNNQPKIDVMCINKPNPKVWPSKYWGLCDHSQYTRNQAAWESYQGMVISATSVRTRHRNQVVIRNLVGTNFSKDLLKGYFIGRSSTYANMQVALWMGYDKVYILGCDMSAVNGQLHCYGNNPDVAPNVRIERFNAEAESYAWAGKNLSEEERQKFVFCSNYNKFPFVKLFDSLDHTIAIQTILDRANNK